jgi:hypothetical protein
MSTYTWSISGNGTISGATNGQTVSVLANNSCGSFTLTLIITDANGCTSTCSQTFDITTPPVVLTAPADFTATSCQTQAQIDAAYASWLAGVTSSGGCTLNVTNNAPAAAPSICGGAVTVTWTAASPCEPNVTASATFTVPAVTPIITVTGTVANGCSNTANATIVVTPSPDGGIISQPVTIVCANNNSGTLSLSGHGGVIVRWESSTNAGASWTQIANTTNTLTYANLGQTTLYRVLIESGDCSAYSAPAVVSVIPLIIPTAVANPSLICIGDSSTLSAIASGFPGSWSGVEDFNNASLDNSGGWTATANGGPHNIEAVPTMN